MTEHHAFQPGASQLRPVVYTFRGNLCSDDSCDPDRKAAGKRDLAARDARELQEHIKQISGADLKQIPEVEYSPQAGSCISIGRAALSAKHVNDEKIDDGHRVFTENGKLFMVGRAQTRLDVRGL